MCIYMTNIINVTYYLTGTNITVTSIIKSIRQSIFWDTYTGDRPLYCNGPCGDRTPGRSLQSTTPKPLGHKGTWTTQWLMLGWFVTLLLPFWNPSPLPWATFNQGFSTQTNPGYRCHRCNGPCGDRTRVARARVQCLNHWAIKVPERSSPLCLTGS